MALFPVDLSSGKKNQVMEVWKKAMQGWAKLNFDAGFLVKDKKGSWGAILRDGDGKVIMSAWGRLEHFQTAEMAEALAGLESLKVILAVFTGKVHMENDCAALVTKLKSKSQSKSAISDVFRETWDLLRCFEDFDV
jgi:ribonuclease HI